MKLTLIFFVTILSSIGVRGYSQGPGGTPPGEGEPDENGVTVTCPSGPPTNEFYNFFDCAEEVLSAAGWDCGSTGVDELCDFGEECSNTLGAGKYKCLNAGDDSEGLDVSVRILGSGPSTAVATFSHSSDPSENFSVQYESDVQCEENTDCCCEDAVGGPICKPGSKVITRLIRWSLTEIPCPVNAPL
jgi:hypothetical protein